MGGGGGADRSVQRHSEAQLDPLGRLLRQQG